MGGTAMGALRHACVVTGPCRPRAIQSELYGVRARRAGGTCPVGASNSCHSVAAPVEPSTGHAAAHEGR
eukprot:4585681-Alexandrium_andersonii.AAC.1